MQPSLTDLAHYCDVGVFNAHLTLSAKRRSADETAELMTYMATPAFGERCARLEQRVRAGIANGAPVPLVVIAAELELPVDLAAGWLDALGVPIDLALGWRGTA